jgi:tetratricopeptide (TPR) repeat protein
MDGEPTTPPTHPPDDTPESRAPGLDFESARLFEIASPAWATRLREAHESLPPGRLGAYHDLVEIGRGGQGEVYRAVQPGTGRVVALKRIAGLGLSPSPTLLTRFTREVEAITRLSHPNVVSVFAMEVIDGHSLLVMEYIEGRQIDQWADAQWGQSAEPLNQVLRVFAAVCDGVAHAHQRGVLHRDLKPSNILVTDAGLAKVLDFGIARMLDEQSAKDAAVVWTTTGFAGTPAYASPEQLASGAGGIDTRSDVYSLGVMLYRLLTGQEAFDTRRGVAALLTSIGSGPIRAPSGVRAGLPGECDWIVRKATDPEPSRRYQTVEALADDVRRLLDGRGVLAHPPSVCYAARRMITRRPWTSLAIASAVTLVTILSIVAAVQAIRLSVRSRALTAALVVANQQRERAEEEQKRQARLNEQLVTIATAVTEDNGLGPGRIDPTALQMLIALAGQLTSEDADETVLAIRSRLGFSLQIAGRPEDALSNLDEALAIARRTDNPSSKRLVQLHLQRSRVLRALDRPSDALATIDSVMPHISPTLRDVHVASLRLERMLTVSQLKRPTEEVVAAAQQAIEAAGEWLSAYEFPYDDYMRARVREEAAIVAIARGRYELAAVWAGQAVDIATKAASPKIPPGRYMYQCGLALVGLNRLSEAEAQFRAAIKDRWPREPAHGSSPHKYFREHARVLHRMGRFPEAAMQWELALLRPLGMAKPSQGEIAAMRLALAAARFGAGEATAGRMTLALAVSRGRTPDADDPAIREPMQRVEVALRQNGWQLTDQLRVRLGDLSWLMGPEEIEKVIRREPDNPDI